MDTKARVIRYAQQEFLYHGYKNASLTRIAALSEIKPASIYHHFPRGKEEIYLSSQQAELTKYRTILHQLLSTTIQLEDYLLQFASWYFEQPPMNMQIITQMDMKALSKKGQGYLNQRLADYVFDPLTQGIQHFHNEFKPGIHTQRFVGVFFSLLTSVASAIQSGYDRGEAALSDSLNMLLHGVLKIEACDSPPALCYNSTPRPIDV